MNPTKIEKKIDKPRTSQTQKISSKKMMILEREESMVRPNGGIPTFRKAHFLKPFFNSTNQQPSLSKPPSLSLSSNPKIIQDVTKMVSFKGTPNPQRLWKSWIDELQPTHQSIWKKVGIFDAIASSGYYIKKDNELIISLAEKWCPETNTFIFSWGECTITLEDVMILGGFPVLGVSVLTPSKNRNFDDIEASLVNSCSEIMSNSNNLVTHLGWMKYFKGRGGHLEHVAFLVLWLSRYVFPTNVYNTIAPNLFSIAISLANGTKIALAHAVLASIYRDLSLLNEKIVSFISDDGEIGSSKLVLTGPLYLVHVWAWERFTRLGKKPKFLACGEPRLARWHGSKKSKNGSLRLQDVESFGDDFLWRPYALNVKNWEVPKFYCDQGMWLLVNSAMDEQLLSFTRCLMACDLIGVDCMELYLPHRVGMQFAMDQDIPDPILRLNDDLELALSSYEKSFDGLKIYIPPRWLEGDVTINYYEWWRSTLSPCDHESLTIPDKQRRSLGKVVEVSGVPVCSTPSCNEAMVLISAGSRKETPNDNPSYIPEIAIQKNPSNVFDKNKQISTIDLTVWSEDTGICEHNVVEEGEENEVCKSKLNANEGSKAHMECIHLQNHSLAEDQETLNREETLLDTTLSTICYTFTKDEHAETANHSTDIKQYKSAAVAFLNIRDGEENEEHYGSVNLFEELILEFEARISGLERTISALKTAKFGSSMR